MAKRYRMTSARKAALKKAQLASARKRRRRIAAGAIVAIGAGTAAGYYGRKRRNTKMYGSAHMGFVRSAMRPQLALPAGKKDVTRHGKTRPGGGVITVKGKQRGNVAKKGKPRIIKVNGEGQARVIGRARPKYDARRRAQYDPITRRVKYFQHDKGKRKSRAKRTK